MPPETPRTLRQRLYVIIFEHDTAAGRAFDIAVLVAVLTSVLVVMLESVPSVAARWGASLRAVEWVFTGLFTVEYVLRVYSAPRRRTYVFSFFGLLDLVAILPTFVSALFPSAQSLLVVRVLRLLRTFRVLKLANYAGQGALLLRALRASLPKITVFLVAVLSVVLVMASLMYLVEGPKHGFTSIPTSAYWAIVTLTTVGFGDITPKTPLGQLFASVLMVLGYGIIAVPTGIVTSELVRTQREDEASAPVRRCARCGERCHTDDAAFCRLCGNALTVEPPLP